MGFIIVCYECGYTLYNGRGMILVYKLRREINNRCPGCGRKLSVKPLSIKVEDKELNQIWSTENV
jgi:DNA-directed RNA polymerase subunit RPC12/RpoP